LNRLVIIVLLSVSIVVGADNERPLRTPKLSPDHAKKRDLILPGATERSYRKIAWRTSVLQGIIDAQKNDKPVMIVLMNGHPLGCT
jgi:hypothetical protein